MDVSPYVHDNGANDTNFCAFETVCYLLCVRIPLLYLQLCPPQNGQSGVSVQSHVGEVNNSELEDVLGTRLPVRVRSSHAIPRTATRSQSCKVKEI